MAHGGHDDSGRAWYRVDPAAGCVVLAVGGEVEAATAKGLHEAVRKALESSSCLVIDLSQVTFIDSSGLGVIIVARNLVRAREGSLALVNPPSMVRKILWGTQLQPAFSMFDNRDEAVAAVTV
jgi:anti-anti-sigma factor